MSVRHLSHSKRFTSGKAIQHSRSRENASGWTTHTASNTSAMVMSGSTFSAATLTSARLAASLITFSYRSVLAGILSIALSAIFPSFYAPFHDPRLPANLFQTCSNTPSPAVVRPRHMNHPDRRICGIRQSRFCPSSTAAAKWNPPPHLGIAFRRRVHPPARSSTTSVSTTPVADQEAISFRLCMMAK